MYTYILISPLSCLSLPPSLSHPSRWSQSTELISPCGAAASHQLFILHLVVYLCQCYSVTSSQLTLPPPHVLKFILYICVFIPVLPLCSSGPLFFFWIPYICVSIRYLFFSFWLTSLCMTDWRDQSWAPATPERWLTPAARSVFTKWPLASSTRRGPKEKEKSRRKLRCI